MIGTHRYGALLTDDADFRVAAERFPGNTYLQGADHGYSTYECVVYRIANGRVAESTDYINWLDPYVQVALVDPSNLTT